jgi:predicted AAA+ superfamily ATPase
MERDIEKILLDWKQKHNRMPLLLRGARQVGKSYIVNQFGRSHFENVVTVNFEQDPWLSRCFDNLHPHEIIMALSLSMNQKIIPGKTLLFLDEIQDCPNAIRSLRYFKEQYSELHVIGAGSLLEFALNQEDFRMPVGRIQSLYLKPLSFKEFLLAMGHSNLRHFIEEVDLNKNIPDSVHLMLLKLVRQYMVIGGMPGVLQSYLSSDQKSNQYDLTEAELQQTILLTTYRQDFSKYTKHSQIQYIQRVFEKAPGIVGSHVKYANIDKDARSNQIKLALELLQHAGLIYPIYSTAASGLPLITLVNEKKFKILFLDVGLMARASRLSAELWLDENLLLVNRGACAEQFVGQELLAYGSSIEAPQLFFWHRDKKSSLAEVDYILNFDSKIVPIEVKAGSTGQLKSLQLLMQEKNIYPGVRISQHPLSFDGKILSIPLYMIGEIERLLNVCV